MRTFSMSLKVEVTFSDLRRQTLVTVRTASPLGPQRAAAGLWREMTGSPAWLHGRTGL